MGSKVTVEVEEAYAVKYAMENEFLLQMKEQRKRECKAIILVNQIELAMSTDKSGHNHGTAVLNLACALTPVFEKRNEIFTLKQHSGIANLIQASLDLAGPCSDV